MNLSGSPLDLLVAFVGGVVLSFTPCVYPLIPVTAGYIGASSAGSRARALTLSLIYVSGVATTYSLLGIFASLFGTLFGSWAASPLTNIFVGGVIIIFGISMLDLFQIRLPFIRLSAHKKKGYLSVFVLGLSSGLVIGPCLTPVLGSILVYLATKKNILYGAALLFSFAYGMGFLLILVGIFSGILVNLPRSGKWMVSLKKICAFIMIGVGLYFIYFALKKI